MNHRPIAAVFTAFALTALTFSSGCALTDDASDQDEETGTNSDAITATINLELVAQKCATSGHVWDADSNVCTTACLAGYLAQGSSCLSPQQVCAAKYKVWNLATSTCAEQCVAGSQPFHGSAGLQCIAPPAAETQASCDKKDGIWTNGKCVGVITCPIGQHGEQSGTSQYCVADNKPTATYSGDLPCQVGLLCPTDPLTFFK
jgi:hypothetical protein